MNKSITRSFFLQVSLLCAVFGSEVIIRGPGSVNSLPRAFRITITHSNACCFRKRGLYQSQTKIVDLGEG